MSLVLRELATKTSWAHSSKSRLTQGEWVPASMAIRIGASSEAKRRLKASGFVRSLPSSITSPLCWSMRQRGRSICRLGPIRLSPSVALCYYPWWADPPLWAVRARILLADPKGTAYGGSAFSSYLRRISLLSSTLAIWAYDAPHRVGITRSPLGLFAGWSPTTTRKKSLDTKWVVFAGALWERLLERS